MIILAGILNILIPLITLILVVVAVLLVLVCLMQRPKNEGLGAAFGGGMTDQMFGAQTTNVLQKATVWLGILFFSSTLVLAILQTRNNTANEIKTGVTTEEAESEGLSLAEQLDKAEAEQGIAKGDEEEMPAEENKETTDATTTTEPSLTEQLENATNNEAEKLKIDEKAEHATQSETNIIEDASDKVKETIDATSEGIKETTEKATDSLKTVTEPIQESAGAIKSKATDVAKDALNKTTEGASTITESVKETGSNLIDATKKKALEAKELVAPNE